MPVVFDDEGVVLSEYPDYVIHEDGRVISMLSDKFVSNDKRNGYLYFSIVKILEGGVRKRTSVGQHQLVAMAYLPNPENLTRVGHKNGNGYDNRIENLFWATQSQISKLSHDSGNTSK